MIKKIKWIGLSVSLISINLLTSCDNHDENLHKHLRKHVTSLDIYPIEVKVSHVTDGDTFVYEVDNHPSGTVDLGCNITAFKLKQEHGIQSKLMLESLLPRGSKVTIYPVDYSPNGNISAMVINHNNSVVNYEMILTGWAVINPYKNSSPLCNKRSLNNTNTILNYLNSASATGFHQGAFKDRNIDSVTLPWK